MKAAILLTGLMAFLTHEQISGMNKICFYQGPKGESAITIANYQLCPQTVQQ